MAYTVNRTDSINNPPIIVDDGTVNQQTSLSLPGKNTTSYGTIIAENFVKLLENFSKNTAPVNALEGQLWYDTTVGVDQLKIYDGTQWVAAGGVKKSINEPGAAESVLGDLWVDTDNQQLYLFTGSGWILVGPEFSQGLSTGTKPIQIIGTDNLTYNVVLIEIDTNPVAIIAAEQFTPKATIAGFTQILPGVNLSSTNPAETTNKYYGTAYAAENLIGEDNEVVGGSNFLRKDVDNVAVGELRINNDDGINIGNSASFNLGIESQSAVFAHNTSGASIDFRVNDEGVTKTVLRIDPTTNVGINTLSPDEALDVTGNVHISEELYVDAVTDSTNISSGAAIIKGGVGIAKQLFVGGATTLQDDVTLENIYPSTNNTFDIGSSANKFLTVHANSFVGNLVGNVTGTVSGASGTANKLTSASTFQMTGDVSATSFAFDGQTGGLTKTFATTISNSFIASKDAKSSSQSSDEFIFNRTIGDTGVFKITRDNLLAAIVPMPTGVILPYGGATAPAYWLMCDGSEVDRSTYPELYDIIGNSFGAPSSASVFKLPDLRGRNALGADNMGGTSANRVTNVAADSVGGFSGTETKTISIDNLPEHEHDLRGPSGAQYYAIRNVPGIAAGETTAIVFDAPTGSGQASALPTSGGVNHPTVGVPQDVMNPYVVVNYIIYSGQAP